MGSFEQARREEAEAIPWIGGDRGAREEAALGAAQDDELAILKNALRMQAGPYTCPDDALDLIGPDFDTPRLPGEANGAAPTAAETGSGLRGRICGAWDAAENGGLAAGIIAALRAYGIEDVRVIEDFEGTFAPGDWYSRFWVFLGPAMPWTPLLLGSSECVLGTCTLGSTVGFFFPYRVAPDVNEVKRLVLKHKSAHSYPVAVVLMFETTELLGINTTLGSMTLGAGDDAAIWRIGKLFGLDTAMPFTLGGYEV